MDEVRIMNATRPFTNTLRVRWEIIAPDDAPPDGASPAFNFEGRFERGEVWDESKHTRNAEGRFT